VQHLRELGYRILPPDDGDLAVGEGRGPGRMPEPETIFAHTGRLLEPTGAFAGRRVVVSAGPTQEALDPVRFISNHSSGKMGVALAAAAWRRGADVALIAGPMKVSAPVGAQVTDVHTTAEMADAVKSALPTADVLIMAAAPADFTPVAPAARKIKKSGAAPMLELTSTPDILKSTRAARRPGAVVVGFALETDDVLAHGRAKLEAKALDLIVVNDATEPGAGFGGDTNRVTLLDRSGGEQRLELMSKDAVADASLDRVEELLSGR
jgi:phosphopantothenoylcysteine decarboxylase/phosphopantothenate--cysteine ligase